ncbi:MAG TPA: nucleotidyltransferase [Chryseolinea sp.]
MLTPEQKKQFNEIFDHLSKSLNISKERYDQAVASYQFVGDWLARPESALAPYKPEILPQGSFIFGTMIEPVDECDDLDIDLVCRLTGKNDSWTQYHLKKIVGDRLKDHGTFKRMLDKEGRRCWTLLHRDQARFHMDILPAIINEEYFVILEKAMSANRQQDFETAAIRITDKLTHNYSSSTNPDEWLKSNPFGLAAWFKLRASLALQKAMSLNEAIQPVPDNETNKLPLQCVVQILKRHRDILFKGDEQKPISIIITVLSARAYKGETDVLDALISIVNTMENFIEERYDRASGKNVKWISNPVNPEENFADKWPAEPAKQEKFFKWLECVKKDVNQVITQKGLHNIQTAMAKSFGERTVNNVFSKIGENAKAQRDGGVMKMAASTGVLGSSGRAHVGYHNNFGK